MLVLRLISVVLFAFVQDSTSGPDPPKFSCSSWHNKDDPTTESVSLLHFNAAAKRQLNCYRTIAGLPDLKLCGSNDDDDDKAVMRKADKALADAADSLQREHEESLSSKKPPENGDPSNGVRNANTGKSSSEKAAKQVVGEPTSVIVDRKVLTGAEFGDLLFLSIGSRSRQQYGETVAVLTNDWKAILSTGITKVIFHAKCLPGLNKFAAVAQYNHPADPDEEKLRKVRQQVFDRLSKINHEPCKDPEVINKLEREAAASKGAAIKSVKSQSTRMKT